MFGKWEKKLDAVIWERPASTPELLLLTSHRQLAADQLLFDAFICSGSVLGGRHKLLVSDRIRIFGSASVQLIFRKTLVLDLFEEKNILQGLKRFCVLSYCCANAQSLQLSIVAN
jgi:hypothetical protein